VIRRGLLDRRRAIIAWGGSLGALTAFMAAIYPSIQGSIEQLTKSYPSGLKEAFGAQAMNTVEGYVHAEMFSLIVPLALGYVAVRAVAAPTAGAEERGHLETILALPISRSALMAGSYLVAALTTGAMLVLIGAMTLLAGGSRARTSRSDSSRPESPESGPWRCLAAASRRSRRERCAARSG
jgi:ABC-2 type transport system permease protein